MGTNAEYEQGVMARNSDRERLGTRQCLSTCYQPATALVGANYTYLILVLIGSLSYLRQL